MTPKVSGAPSPRALGEILQDPEIEKKRALLVRTVFWKPDLSFLFGRSTKTLDRWVDKGIFPKPDRHLNGEPLWFRGTLNDWAGGESKLWGFST